MEGKKYLYVPCSLNAKHREAKNPDSFTYPPLSSLLCDTIIPVREAQYPILDMQLTMNGPPTSLANWGKQNSCLRLHIELHEPSPANQLTGNKHYQAPVRRHVLLLLAQSSRMYHALACASKGKEEAVSSMKSFGTSGSIEVA